MFTSETSGTAVHRSVVNARLASTIRHIAWAINLCIGAIIIYGLVHDGWSGWPWENQAVLMRVVLITGQGMPSVSLWIAGVLALAMIYIVAFLLTRFARPTWLELEQSIRPYAVVVLWGAILINMLNPTDAQIVFATTGISYRWGFVRWSDVRAYSWQTPVDPSFQGEERLNLVLASRFPWPQQIDGYLPLSQKPAVAKLLARYVPATA